jgi:hypothetical protein
MKHFAYTFWLWRFRDPEGAASPSPTIETALEAERYARESDRIAAVEKPWDAADHAASLGEVLLAQGRPAEAIKVLKRATGLLDGAAKVKAPRPDGNEQSTGTHWRNDEVLWDLGQAYLCAGSREPAGAQAQALTRNGVTWYGQIRANEEQIEARPYSQYPRALSPLHFTAACGDRRARDSLYGMGPFAPVYRVGKATPPLASGARPGQVRLSWIRSTHGALELIVTALPPGTRVRIWGNGVFEELAERDEILLARAPFDSREEYFARLETLDGAPLSPALPLRTYRAPARARIQLTFTPPAGLRGFQVAIGARSNHGYDVQLPGAQPVVLKVLRIQPGQGQVATVDHYEPAPGENEIHLDVPENEIWHVQAWSKAKDTEARAVSAPLALPGGVDPSAARLVKLEPSPAGPPRPRAAGRRARSHS